MHRFSHGRCARFVCLILLLVATMCAACRKAEPITPDPIKAEPPAAEAERERFHGAWKHLSIDFNGEQALEGIAREFLYRFEGNRYTNTRSGKVMSQGTFTLDPAKEPRAIDFMEAGGVRIYGIYRLEGDKLTICAHEQQRPSEFESRAGQMRSLVVLERLKP
jgi:uncharacterized protein (TIGR03067 family)